MSYKEKKESIRLDTYYHINRYKNGTKQQQKIGEKIEEIANQIRCFQCLDTKQSWYFRGAQHNLFGFGNCKYYKMTCAVCPDNSVRDKWIEDSDTNEIYGASGVQLFNKVNYSGAERFKELEKLALARYPEARYPELNEKEEEAPSYKKTEKNNVSVKKKTYNLKLEIGNIVNKCQEIFRAQCGDIISIASLVSSIELHISSCENTNKQEHVICEEIDSKNFIYIKIQNNSVTKKKSILGLYEYNKYKLDIEVHIFILKPDNSSAYNECKVIVNKLATNDIASVNDLFLSIEK